MISGVGTERGGSYVSLYGRTIIAVTKALTHGS